MKESVTKKLYHKRFTHRMYIRTAKKVEAGPTSDVVKWFMAKNCTDFKTQVSSVYNKNNKSHYSYWDGRNFDNHITVYYLDETLTEKLKAEFGDAIKELEKPRDSTHLEVLQTERVLTRKELFYKKFRVACRLSSKHNRYGHYTTSHIEEIQEWCNENLEADTWRINSYWATSTVFLKDRKSAMLFKLVWSDDIKSTERIILLDEIDSDDAE